MFRLTPLFLTVCLLLQLIVPSAPALAEPLDPFAGCEQGVFADTGASWVICMPQRLSVPWNGDLMLYAHGYVSPYPDRPPEIPVDHYALPGGTDFPSLANSLGYAFATTSYRKNGLAVADGVADIMQLRGEFKSRHPLKRASRVFVFGASEGGLVAARAIERFPAQFDGGVAACGPLGDMRRQVDYVGDMRVLFDLFFPGLLAPTPVEIPETLMVNWPAMQGTIAAALAGDAPATGQLIAVSKAPVDPADPASAVATVLAVLWYNAFATNDARMQLGGNPFDNTARQYAGSLDDLLLNSSVARYAAANNAVTALRVHYQTTGRLERPLVTLHNTLDPVVPYWHSTLYADKVAGSSSTAYYAHIPVAGYGHCAFTIQQVMAALNLVVSWPQ